jgi:hypothetical protein
MKTKGTTFIYVEWSHKVKYLLQSIGKLIKRVIVVRKLRHILIIVGDYVSLFYMAINERIII